MAEPRIDDTILVEHLAGNRQMAFVSGPRQVGKTTACRRQADVYVNWDDVDDRELILAGPRRLASAFDLDRLKDTQPVVLFDELLKFPRWKSFLKGFYDSHAGHLGIAVTGSSRLDVYRRGGDSLMGRYFPSRMHPFSVAEVVSQTLPDQCGSCPRAPSSPNCFDAKPAGPKTRRRVIQAASSTGSAAPRPLTCTVTMSVPWYC